MGASLERGIIFAIAFRILFSSWAFWQANVSPGHNFVETVLAGIESLFDNLRHIRRRKKAPA